jgi:hypothetical protein
MRGNRPQYEARAWTLTMEVIGQKLRERCRQPNDLSPRLLALVKKLDEKIVRDTSVETSKAAAETARGIQEGSKCQASTQQRLGGVINIR